MIVDSISSPAAAGSQPCRPGIPNVSYGIATGGDGTLDANFSCGSLVLTGPSSAVKVHGVTTTVEHVDCYFCAVNPDCATIRPNGT